MFIFVVESGVTDMGFQEPHWLTDLKKIFLKCLEDDEGQLHFDNVLIGYLKKEKCK